ncbi:MAG: nucleotidyltransferase family protein [Candidatus Omnitrophota bacterium]
MTYMKRSQTIPAQYSAHMVNAEKFVVLCVQYNGDESLREQAMAFIAEGIDWEYFVDISVAQKIAVMVYNVIYKIVPPECIPCFVFDALRNAYLYIVSKTLLKHTETLKLLRLCAQAQVKVVPLKGTILAKRLYGQVHLRDLSSDIDLFIEEKDKLCARDILAREGYVLRLRGNDDYSGYNEFMKAGFGSIDLQWKIVETIDCSRSRLEGFWRAVQKTEEEDITFSVFQTEELLLYLCAHSMSKHCFGQLRHICDIHQLLVVEHAAIDWNRIVAKAKEWNLLTSLYCALSMRQYFFKISVAPEIKKVLKISRFKIMLLKVFTDELVFFRRQSFRRRLVDRFLGFVFFRFVEARSLRDYFFFVFPPREALQSKSYLTMFWRGLGKLTSVFAR